MGDSSVTDQERASGTFDGYKATADDYAMYEKYSTFRLRLLAWMGDPVAKRILLTR
jgi:hypothetical protein